VQRAGIRAEHKHVTLAVGNRAARQNGLAEEKTAFRFSHHPHIPNTALRPANAKLLSAITVLPLPGGRFNVSRNSQHSMSK
jgi:hypothetical protein